MQKLNLVEFKEFLLKQGPHTKLYIGCDSKRVKIKGIWYADYITVVVVHYNGCNGSAIFGEIDRKVDFDKKPNRPYNRMIAEAECAIAMYKSLEDIMIETGFEAEVHLDINPDKLHGSSVACAAAIGMVKSTCYLDEEVKVKPEAFAASYAADRYTQISARKKRRLLKHGDESISKAA